MTSLAPPLPQRQRRRDGFAVAARRFARRNLPNQHGAWPMLIVPLIGGIGMSRWEWVDLPFIAVVMTSYCAEFFQIRWIRQPHQRRHDAGVRALGYGLASLVLVGVVVLMHPSIWPWFPVLAYTAFVQVAFGLDSQERHFMAEVTAVIGCSLTGLVVLDIGGGLIEPSGARHHGSGLELFLSTSMYFVSTIPYVRSQIRGRGRPGWRWLSYAFHAAAVVVALTVLAPFWAVFFGVALVRAILVPLAHPRPAVIGMIEMVMSVALLIGLIA